MIQFRVVLLRPAQEEYRSAVRQPQELRKIEALLQRLQLFGFQTPGIRFEKGYVKKKKWKLNRADIETAAKRFAQIDPD